MRKCIRIWFFLDVNVLENVNKHLALLKCIILEAICSILPFRKFWRWFRNKNLTIILKNLTITLKKFDNNHNIHKNIDI